MFQNVTESLAIGNVVSPEGLSTLSQQGYQTILDLCTEAENNQLNGEVVEKLGLNLVPFPVNRHQLTPELLQAFIQILDIAPQPIYVRCASGLRAGVMTLLTLATRENWTEQQYLEKRQALGLQHQPHCPLEIFAREYF
jgi:protein tyrosine phosphatase (PTP) superfamily phosphohydrolase (DUF442 family)